MIKEHIEKASHDCGLLRDDISAAYSVACVKNPVLAILLYDMIGELAKVQNRINEINGVV